MRGPTLRWIFISFQLGLGIGLLGGLTVANAFNAIIVLALVTQASIVAVVLGILYQGRKKLGIGRKDLLELSVGLPTGLVLTFIPSLFYTQIVFQTYFAILLLTAPIFVAYRVMQLWIMRKQLNPPQRSFIRNVFAMLFVMVLLLFLVQITYWTIGNTIFASAVMANFARERRNYRLAVKPIQPSL
jgi:hypothetical protein